MNVNPEREVQSSAGEVKHTHAGAAQGGNIGVGPDANAGDINASGKDVDVGSKVGEVGDLVVAGVDSTDGDSVGRRARRRVLGVHLQRRPPQVS